MNDHFLGNDLPQFFNLTFKNSVDDSSISDGSGSEVVAKVISSPFKVLKLHNVIKSSKYVSKLKDDILNLEFHRKNNDLYSLWQSEDLHNFVQIPTINKFIQILKSQIRPLISKVLDTPFNDKISVTASLYKLGDILLCHDDKCDDRKVAFVFYLNSCKPESGGAFQMFEHDENGQPTVVVKSIPPEANSLLCFEVGNFTYHEVSEIVNENFERLSINGWFHGNKDYTALKYIDPFPKLISQIQCEGFLFLDEFLNLSYCTPSLILDIQQQFELNSYCMLANFFLENFYKSCEEELKHSVISWTTAGPANRRKYEKAEINQLTGSLATLIKFLRAPMFISYLKNITGLSLVPSSGADVSASLLILEVQCWSPGSYTMATDNDSFFEKSGLDLYLFFNSKETLEDSDVKGGSITYLATDGDEEDSELLNIEPQDNALIMVYRTCDTIKFTKYINHNLKGKFYCISATYFEPNEL